MKIAIDFVPEQPPTVIHIITRQIFMVAPPCTMAVAQAFHSIVQTSRSWSYAGMLNWATANTPRGCSRARVRAYWCSLILKSEAGPAGRAGDPPVLRALQREPSGAKCREIVAENRPHFAPNFMRRISRADFYPLIALLCPIVQT